MSDEVHDADSCDDQLPMFSSLGDQASSGVPVYSSLGADGVVLLPSCVIDDDGAIPVYSTLEDVASCDVPIISPVGADALIQLPTYSTIGKGPKGDTGPAGPPGMPTQEMVDAALDERIVLVAAADWPPAEPEENVLYLKGP